MTGTVPPACSLRRRAPGPRGRAPAQSSRGACASGSKPWPCPSDRLRTRSQWARGEAVAEVIAGRRGGGSMAASLRLRRAASGLRYWSHRQRPAAASFAAGKDLAPRFLTPLPGCQPLATRWPKRSFPRGCCSWVEVLKNKILASSTAAFHTLTLPEAPSCPRQICESVTFLGLRKRWRSA